MIRHRGATLIEVLIGFGIVVIVASVVAGIVQVLSGDAPVHSVVSTGIGPEASGHFVVDVVPVSYAFLPTKDKLAAAVREALIEWQKANPSRRMTSCVAVPMSGDNNFPGTLVIGSYGP